MVQHERWPEEEVSHDPEQPTSGSTPQAREIIVDVCGVSVFIPETLQVILVDGRKPRPAVNASTVIPPHVPFIALPPKTFKVVAADGEQPQVPKLSFDFSLDGKLMEFQAFILDRHRISFPDASSSRPRFEGKKFATMQQLAPHLELCTGVPKGTSRQSVGVIDCRNATRIIGKPHHEDDAPLVIGGIAFDVADMLAAVFEPKPGTTPRIRIEPLDKERGRPARGRGANERGRGAGADDRDESLILELEPNAFPWRILIGNVPFEELVASHVMDEGHDIPLTHVELVYDLFHLSRSEALNVPRVTNHAHTRTMNGRCGPTVATRDPGTKG